MLANLSGRFTWWNLTTPKLLTLDVELQQVATSTGILGTAGTVAAKAHNFHGQKD